MYMYWQLLQNLTVMLHETINNHIYGCIYINDRVPKDSTATVEQMCHQSQHVQTQGH